MASQVDLQSFLRFLSQDAKIPLATAMGKVKQFREKEFLSIAAIAAARPAQIREIFESEGEAADKLAKQVHNAAKRVSKRKAGESAAHGDLDNKPRKKQKSDISENSWTQKEAALALPDPSDDIEVIRDTVLVTNRAPLVLAFAVILLKHTMPKQPLSSRLSLAQALVSLNSKRKAISLGIESGTVAEDEGWGKGQPGICIMGREVKVMKRWGYDSNANDDANDSDLVLNAQESMADGEVDVEKDASSVKDIPLWGIDLESLKQSDKSTSGRSASLLPIHTPESARAYLLKSFASSKRQEQELSAEAAPKKAAIPKRVVAEKEQNLSLLLGAIELLYASWRHLPAQELDRRAWSWYIKVRPEVDHGPAGWGGKGDVALKAILNLCKPE